MAAGQVIWRVRLARGERHADIEAAIEGAHRLATVFALALLDDPARGGGVLRTLNQRHRPAGRGLGLMTGGIPERFTLC